MDCPGGDDDERTGEENDKFGELEEFEIDGGKNKRNKNGKKVEGDDDD